jgi:alpha-tubulin suppressor-like RCC1 family protein
MQRRSARSWIAVAQVFAAMIVASCGGKDSTTTGPRIGTLAIVSGSGQTAPGGLTLSDPFVVLVADQTGTPIQGVTVTWTVLSGGGTITPPQSTTGSDGHASALLTLGTTPGINRVQASFGSGQPVEFAATATTAPPVGGGVNVTYMAVSAGSKHSCALSVGGVAYCWGYNGDGQLGIGADVEGSGPVFAFPQPLGATGNLTFGKLFGGYYHTCGLTLSGVGQCWGVNVDGRLGINSFEPVNEPTQISVKVAFSIIAAGQGHTCALDLAHNAYCWGRGSEGQLGVGPLPPLLPPLTEAAPKSLNASYRTISAGGLHTCAIDAGGAGWCWGNNFYGQVGDGSSTDQVTPVPITGGLGFKAISAGKLHTCALDNSGAAYCWGRNDDGQLGTGNTTGSNAPMPVAGAHAFVAISAGTSHTCGLAAGGEVFCWGKNDHGQLGDGTITSTSTPTQVAGGLVFASVSVGAAHTCGVTTANVAYCWGDNQFGQLGDGTLTVRVAPAKVALQP